MADMFQGSTKQASPRVYQEGEEKRGKKKKGGQEQK